HLLARGASFVFPAPNASQLPRKPDSRVPYLYYCDPVGVADDPDGAVLPTSVVDITGQMDRKVGALAAHASQREWLRAHHGMDEYIEAMTRHARMRGASIGTAYAEAFVQHRGHPYPTDDILATLTRR